MLQQPDVGSGQRDFHENHIIGKIIYVSYKATL